MISELFFFSFFSLSSLFLSFFLSFFIFFLGGGGEVFKSKY